MSDPNPSEQPVQPPINAVPDESPKDFVERNPSTNEPGAMAAAAICGISSFGGAMFFIVVFSLVLDSSHASARQLENYIPSRGYLVGISLIAVIAVWFIGQDGIKKIGRWALVGFLIGAGIGCLINGVCFVAHR